jgi:hypothetical protein
MWLANHPNEWSASHCKGGWGFLFFFFFFFFFEKIILKENKSGFFFSEKCSLFPLE